MTDEFDYPSTVDAPSISLLCKLGSIVVHVDEGCGEDSHVFDWVAIRNLISDPEVKEWLAGMGARALLPVKRS